MRGIPSAEHLNAAVEGDIEEVDGVLRITTIRIQYQLKAPAEAREKIDRALESYADKCPAYASVKGCIDCSWELELIEP